MPVAKAYKRREYKIFYSWCVYTFLQCLEVNCMLTKRIYDELELLSRHIRVLEVVMKKQPVGIIRISQILGIEEHEVRRSLAALENNGFIKPTPNGAIIDGNIKDGLLELAEQLGEIEDIVKILRKKVLTLVV